MSREHRQRRNHRELIFDNTESSRILNTSTILFQVLQVDRVRPAQVPLQRVQVLRGRAANVAPLHAALRQQVDVLPVAVGHVQGAEDLAAVEALVAAGLGVRDDAAQAELMVLACNTGPQKWSERKEKRTTEPGQSNARTRSGRLVL